MWNQEITNYLSSFFKINNNQLRNSLSGIIWNLDYENIHGYLGVICNQLLSAVSLEPSRINVSPVWFSKHLRKVRNKKAGYLKNINIVACFGTSRYTLVLHVIIIP